MSATITRVPNGEDNWGKQRVMIVDVVGDSSYPTGGYTISPARVGMKTILGAQVLGGNAAGGKLLAAWDTVNGKLIFSYPTGGGNTAPAALADPTATGGAITVTDGAVSITAGATPVTSTAANGAIGTQAQTTAVQAVGTITPGRAKEVKNATDLSTITVRMVFIGN